eukprot:513070-Rhodomonas_salina.1
MSLRCLHVRLSIPRLCHACPQYRTLCRTYPASVPQLVAEYASAASWYSRPVSLGSAILTHTSYSWYPRSCLGSDVPCLSTAHPTAGTLGQYPSALPYLPRHSTAHPTAGTLGQYPTSHASAMPYPASVPHLIGEYAGTLGQYPSALPYPPSVPHIPQLVP